MLESFITPPPPTIVVGESHPNRVPVSLNLKMLFRMGALVVGGVGTGKSTLLMTLINKMLETLRPVHILLIDWDGEYNSPVLAKAAEGVGGYLRLTAPMKIHSADKVFSPTEWYNRFRQVSGLPPQSKGMRALFAVVKKLEEDGVQSLAWNREVFERLLEQVEGEEARSLLAKRGKAIPREGGRKDGVDVVELVREKALVHLDFTDASNWDEIINTSREVLEAVYFRARGDHTFGAAVFIDEVHNFVPQSIHEGAASRQAYEEFIPVMKLIATTGPRNGVPLFIATQRLSEVDKFISTQMGQNIFAFRVEDVDLDRLRGIMGSDVAYAARNLPRGVCIYKGHALRIQKIVIIRIQKTADVASVGKDLLTRWSSSQNIDSQKTEPIR